MDNGERESGSLPAPLSLGRTHRMPNRLAFIFYAILCVLVFALSVLAYIPGGLSIFDWPPAREPGG